MMQPDKIEKLIMDGDGHTLELKYDFPSSVEKTVSAFANTNGGYIVFGFNDEGKVVGLTQNQIDDFSKRAVSLCQAMSVSFELYPSNFDMKQILVLHIYKKEFHYSVRTSDGLIWLRQGAKNVLMPAKEDFKLQKGMRKQLKCFVAMSFREQEYPRLVDFYDAMKRAADRCAYRLKLWKNDEDPFNGNAVMHIHENIKKCDFMLADYTLNSSNVYYEEGFAAGMGKEIIQTCENTTDLAFDINHNNTYSYANAHQLEDQLVDSFNEICKRLLS